VGLLAKAGIEDVLAHWAGLGYYSRARNLFRASQVISEKYDGEFPRDRKTLLKVPGIGPYTAGAVLSIAYDMKEPLVDGNVERVFSRLFLLEKPIKQKEMQDFLWNAAASAVNAAESPRVFNQALMELGALVCTKGTPRCELCPIQSFCEAKAAGVQERLPVKAKPKEKVDLFWLGLVFEQNGKLLLKQNESGSWWHGLWDFPHLHFTSQRLLHKEESDCGNRYPHREILPLSPQKHTVTHHRITFKPMLIRLEKNKETLPQGKWFSRRELEKLPLSSLARKVVKHLDVLELS
jgi:A/G-specific adenine glycosylase